MYEPENENEISHQTEENSGEYRYGGGFEKEDIYADAHYTPAGESTVPPRYYTPPEPKKTVKLSAAASCSLQKSQPVHDSREE